MSPNPRFTADSDESYRSLMAPSTLRFVPYEETGEVANIVVDGSPNAGTVLVISHWPGLPTPPHCAADTSAEMVFRYLDRGADLHQGARVVTNNHFDQDGLAGVYALLCPDDALRRRTQLEGLASAGDFAVAPDRHAARLSMAVAALSDPTRSPLGVLPEDYGEACGALYDAALTLLPAWLDDPDRCRPLWHDEDADLDAGYQAITSGAVSIDEDTQLDVAVVRLADAERSSGHRFVGRTFHGIHPIALHHATERTTILIIDPHEGRHHLTCRYEGWVQFRSRPIRPRVDLRPLADQLSAAEPGRARWVASPPSDLTPELHTGVDSDPSSIDPPDLIDTVTDYFRTAAPAWDSYAAHSAQPPGDLGPAGVSAWFCAPRARWPVAFWRAR